MFRAAQLVKEIKYKDGRHFNWNIFYKHKLLDVNVNSSAEAEDMAQLVERSHLTCIGAWAFNTLGTGVQACSPSTWEVEAKVQTIREIFSSTKDWWI